MAQGMYKKIYDPVHGFIKISFLEKELVDTYLFQRLHNIHQLGVSYLVYPGASHTRFEHSLGVMEIASQMYDRITEDTEYRPETESMLYWRQIVRLAALCHDIGHLPFSHVAERAILGENGHEYWTASFIESPFLSHIWNKVEDEFPGKDVKKDVMKIAIGEGKLHQLGEPWCEVTFSPWEVVMSQIITGDFFGADRIDYLLRDARCTGVSYGLFDYHQLMEMLRILPSMDGKGLTLGVEENGIASCEALLLARHFMHKRVYQHPSVQSYSFHMARFMKKLYQKENVLCSLQSYLAFTDVEVLFSIRRAFFDVSDALHRDAEPFFMRDSRYVAIELPSSVQESLLQAWQRQFGIEEAEYAFATSRERKEDSFPVLSGHMVVDARSCCDVVIPSSTTNWLYLCPKYQHAVTHLMEQERACRC